MIEKQTKIEHARWVEGDLGLHFVYTAGVAGEQFLRALQKGKILASTCDRCSTTYCPPRIFCEDCFAEITDRHEVATAGTIETLTRMEMGLEGNAVEPEWVAAIRLDGTDTTLLHRVAGGGVAIGSRVEAVWAPKRSGSILDIQHFRPMESPRPRKAQAKASRETNGRRSRRVAPVAR